MIDWLFCLFVCFLFEQTTKWQWWQCVPEIQGWFVDAGCMEVYWELPQSEYRSQVNGYQVWCDPLNVDYNNQENTRSTKFFPGSYFRMWMCLPDLENMAVALLDLLLNFLPISNTIFDLEAPRFTQIGYFFLKSPNLCDWIPSSLMKSIDHYTNFAKKVSTYMFTL